MRAMKKLILTFNTIIYPGVAAEFNGVTRGGCYLQCAAREITYFRRIRLIRWELRFKPWLRSSISDANGTGKDSVSVAGRPVWGVAEAAWMLPRPRIAGGCYQHVVPQKSRVVRCRAEIFPHGLNRQSRSR